jgi:RNA polymerase sigma-70 factor (ECF subfamily)
MGLAEANSEHGEASPASRETPLDFAAQFEASFKILWLVAMSIVADRSAAEDVVQEAALLALGKLDQFEPGTNFRAWMAQMVRFVALNYARKRQKQRAGALDPSLENTSARLASPAQGGEMRLGRSGQLPADQGHFDDHIMSALNSVGETARACLLLRTLEDMEYAEIARILEIPQGTAMSHVHRTRQHLRQCLADLAPTIRKEIHP